MSPVAVLTGGSQGIGLAVLRRLLDSGHRCLVIGRSVPEVEGRMTFMRHDLTDPVEATDAAASVAEFSATHGSVSLLVNNAGGADPVSAADIDASTVERDVTLNLTAPMLLCAAVLPGMLGAQGGSIVNIASTAGRGGVGHLPTYSAAKAGLIAYTQSLAAEHAASGVRSNCVCPGAVVSTSAGRGREELSRRNGLEPNAYEAAMAARTGLGRLLDPDEVAEVVMWLGLGASRAVNGQTVNVCGALSMG